MLFGHVVPRLQDRALLNREGWAGVSSRHIYGSHLRVTRLFTPTLTVTTSGLTGLHGAYF